VLRESYATKKSPLRIIGETSSENGQTSHKKDGKTATRGLYARAAPWTTTQRGRAKKSRGPKKGKENTEKKTKKKEGEFEECRLEIRQPLGGKRGAKASKVLTEQFPGARTSEKRPPHGPVG